MLLIANQTRDFNHVNRKVNVLVQRMDAGLVCRSWLKYRSREEWGQLGSSTTLLRPGKFDRQVHL